MNISKISRSIVVAIFVVCIIFFSFFGISNLICNGRDASISLASVLVKVGYVFAVLILVFIYMYIKDKLSKMHVKRNLSFIYRYIYIVLVIIGAGIVSSKKLISSFSDNKLLFHIVATLIICILIKKIIFNVSKSDMLSVFGMFMYALFPKNIADINTYIYSTIFTISFLGALLVFQIIIDELKQKGLKTRKYVFLSVILGILLGITSALGVSVFVWVAVFVITIFITYNLDNTHINFPKKFMATLTQTKRESLYGIERININKLFVVILIAMVFMISINLTCTKLIYIVDNSLNLEIVKEAIKKSNISNLSFNFQAIKSDTTYYIRQFVGFAPIFYTMVFIYILFMEILAFCLHRKYDTKSTLMKVIFLSLFSSVILLNLNLCYFQSTFTILFVLIAIVNTSNIYLNREERIKMLVA